MSNNIEKVVDITIPSQIYLGDTNVVELKIKSPPSPSSQKLTLIPSDRKEIPLNIIMDSNNFDAVGAYYKTISVPVSNTDSNSIIFRIKAKEEGLQNIKFQFFQESIYIGEVKATIEVINRDPSKHSLKDVSFPLLYNLNLSNPDLTIFIKDKPSRSGFESNVIVIMDDVLLDGGIIEYRTDPSMKFPAIIEDIYKNISLPANIVDRSIKGIGFSLYDELFSSNIKSLYWDSIRNKIRSIRIISDNPWIPWEIIKPWKKMENGNIEEDPFLCEKFIVSRWPKGIVERIKRNVKKIKVIIPNDTDRAAYDERNWIIQFAKLSGITVSIGSNFEDVIYALQEEDNDIIHFLDSWEIFY